MLWLVSCGSVKTMNVLLLVMICFHCHNSNIIRVVKFLTLSGKRLLIHAFCYEGATGEYMDVINSQAIFVTTPYRLNFDRTIEYFKPGLPVVIQVESFYKNPYSINISFITWFYTGLFL